MEEVHDASRFGELPWSRLQPDEFGRTWTVRRGGAHGPGWQICVYRDGATHDADVWLMPAALQQAVEVVRRTAREGAISGIRGAIGVFMRELGMDDIAALDDRVRRLEEAHSDDGR